MSAQTADAVVIGAGIIGASVAYHLKAAAPGWRVVLLEANEAPGAGETRWATGGVRHQFGTEANVRLSLLSAPYFETFEERFGVDPNFRQHGYLFVTADPARVAALDRERALQRALGVPTERLDARELARLCPPLRTDDLIAANFCARDGSVDPHWVLQGFLATFRRLGGELVVRAPVRELTPAVHSAGTAWTVTAAGGRYETPVVVVAAGPQSHDVAGLAGIDVPAHPFRRQVFVAERPAAVPATIPLTVDCDTGWYAHASRAELLLGGTDKDNRPGTEPEVDWSLFDVVYAAATARMPVLADARIVRAYAGIRTLTPDHHAILGPVAERPGCYLACGPSGHGIMHSPAIGLLLTEWITEGQPRSWDARGLLLDRFRSAHELHETAIF